MEDNKDREDRNTEYTGEYGNTIQGEYQEDTTYRYTYGNDDESIHSGDYYASSLDNTTNSGMDNEANGQENSGADGQFQASTGENSVLHEQSQTPLGENSSLQGQSQTPPGENGTFYGQPQTPSGGSSAFYGTQSKPPKKPASFGTKILVSIVCGIIFGLVAGICFNAFHYLTGRMGNVLTSQNNTEKTQISTNKNKQEEKSTNSDSQSSKKDVAAITEQAMPAVVAITSTTKGTDYYDLFGQRYQGRESTSSGSGFIVGQNDKELLIATNNHVVDGAKTISVQFIDGEIYEAQEKGSDSANDLAVVAVTVSSVKKETMDKIKIADLGNSNEAKVGEMVIAIGNALGYGQSVTVGYISAKDREITESDDTTRGTGNTIKALQTDAAINPGNSGGALINMQGQVIGINSAKIAASSVEGVGYAIPISVATPIIDELMNREILSDDEKGYLGISGTEVTQEASVYNMPYGVYVKEVAEGGAAQKGGIKVGDVITAVNKAEVTTMVSLQEKVNSYRKGTKVNITVQRNSNGKYQEKKLTVELQGKESLDNLSDDNGSSNDSSVPDDGNSNGNNAPGNGDYNGNNGSGDGDGSSDDFGSFWDFFR